MEPRIGQKVENLERSLLLIAAAVGRCATGGAPELCNTGYMFASRNEAFDAAEAVPDGPAMRSRMQSSMPATAVTRTVLP